MKRFAVHKFVGILSILNSRDYRNGILSDSTFLLFHHLETNSHVLDSFDIDSCLTFFDLDSQIFVNFHG